MATPRANNPQKRTQIVSDQIYYPHPNQALIHADEHKYRVVVAGRRFGKSALALNEALSWILGYEGQMVWIILPEYKQAKSIYWDDPDINKYFFPYIQAGLLKKNDSELSLYSQRTNSRLILKGADEPDSLRGSGLDLIVWDEVADIKPLALDVVGPTLIDSPNHKVLFMGTPDGYNHFHDMALRGDHLGKIERAGKNIAIDSDYMTYKFSSYDNLTWAEGTTERTIFLENLEREKRKYAEMGQSDWFEQEYMAEFRKRAGAVHKLFSRETHLIEPFEIPFDWKRDRGWDWGSSHPTASIRFATDLDDNWFVEVCYKEKEKTIEQHADAVKIQDYKFITQMGNDPIPGWGDPSGAQWIRELNRLGFFILPAKRMGNTEGKTWLEMAIDKINSKLACKEGHTVFLPDGRRIDNAPSLFILNVSENMPLVDELETLAYKKTNDGLVKTELDDTTDQSGHYDLHACLRYKAISTNQQQISYNYVDPVAVKAQVLTNTPVIDLHNEEERKKAEVAADLAIMNAQKSNY